MGEHGHNFGNSFGGLEIVLGVHQLSCTDEHLEFILDGHHLLSQDVVDHVVYLGLSSFYLANNPA